MEWQRLTVSRIYWLVVICSLANTAFTKSHHNKKKSILKKDKIRISHEHRDPRFTRKSQHELRPNFNAPQLKKKEKEYLAKIEDALQNDEGSLLYTNSWAVQLHQAEVAQADRIAENHGFENMGQVRCTHEDIKGIPCKKTLLLILYKEYP